MKQIIKRWISGTPIETPALALYHTLHPRIARITAQDRLYNQQATAIMGRILDRRSNCIDVGCHQGTVLDDILRFAPEGQHYAFEPLPDFHAGLVKKYSAAANIHLFEAALSDKAGSSSFQHVVANPAYSGLRKRVYPHAREKVVEIEVRLLRLDDVLPRDLEIRFMKIDVEGAELEVLRGAEEILRRCRPYIVFEHGLGATDFYGTRPEMVFDFLAGCGLRVALMGDWLATDGRQSLSREAFTAEFDCARAYYFIACR